MPETFRSTPVNYWLGINLLVLFTIAGPIVIVLGVQEAKPDRRVYAAIFFVAAWGILIAFALWPLVAYLRMRLVFTDTDVEVHGIARTVRVSFADILEINWHDWGAVCLTTARERMRIRLWGYYAHDVVIRFAREIQMRCPNAKQKRWDLFCIGTSPQKLKPRDVPVGANEVRLTRRLWAKYFLISSAAFFLLGCLGWRFLGRPQALAAPLVLLPLWGLLHLLTPKKGIVCRQQSREESAFYWFQLAAFIVFFGGYMAIKEETKHWTSSQQLALFLPFIAFGLTVWLWRSIPFLKQQQRLLAKHREERLDEWDAFLRSSDSGQSDAGTKSP